MPRFEKLTYVTTTMNANGSHLVGKKSTPCPRKRAEPTWVPEMCRINEQVKCITILPRKSSEKALSLTSTFGLGEDL
jgi:hypothetical protein